MRTCRIVDTESVKGVVLMIHTENIESAEEVILMVRAQYIEKVIPMTRTENVEEVALRIHAENVEEVTLMIHAEVAIPGLGSTRWYDRARRLALVPHVDVVAAAQRGWTLALPEVRPGYALMCPLPPPPPWT